MDVFTKIGGRCEPLQNTYEALPSVWCAEQKSMLVVCGACHRILPARQCVRCRIQTIDKHRCDRQESQCKVQ